MSFTQVQIIPDCLICVSLVVACSALVVSHPRCRNRCGGGSHLKILIQAHCPLMFPQNIFHSLCIERLMVFIMGSPFLPWWSGVCTIRWMTWMTDWITRITILHHSIPLNACNKPKTYSLYLPFLCRIFMREKVWYEFDAELNHLWDYNWILIFHKAADKCLPCPFYLLPDRWTKRTFIKIWLIWVRLTY